MEDIKKHSFKIQVGTAIAVALAIIGFAYNFGNYKQNIDNEITECHSKVVSMEVRITANEVARQDIFVKLASIETQLSNINLTMLEIKNDLRK